MTAVQRDTDAEAQARRARFRCERCQAELAVTGCVIHPRVPEGLLTPECVEVLCPKCARQAQDE